MAYRTIFVKGKDRVIFKEGVSAAALTPGWLIGGLPTALAVTSAAAAALPCIVCEDELQGKEISEAFAIGDNVRYGVCPAGTEVAALADGTGVTAGDEVEAKGDGTFSTLAAGVALGLALTTAGAGARFTLEVY